MKKILCLLLTLVLVFACVSCGKFGKDKGGDESEGTVETIAATVNSSNPTEIVTKVDYIAEGQETLTSSYVTEKDAENGIERFVFHTQRYADVEELVPDNIKKLDGTVWKNADGSVKNSKGDVFSKNDAVGYVSEKLNVVKSAFKTYELKDGGNDLSATVEAKNAEIVFGTDIKAVGDISIEIDTNGIYLYNVSVSYTTETGAKVNITTSYGYAVVRITDAEQ